MTTIETSRNPLLSENDIKLNYEISCESDDSENEIPYHAREHAQPFTYGNLPKGFKRSDLNHVDIEELPESSKAPKTSHFLPPSPPVQRRDFNHVSIEELPESPKANKAPAMLPPSPSMLRRSGRPSISPSRPVLKKTPSREEFEEMLRERREQSLREQNHALKEAQNAAIQKDLDELQEKLNKRTLQFKSYDATDGYKENLCREIVKHVETIDLPDEKDHDNTSKCGMSTAVVEAPSKYEPALILAEPGRPETPAFPVSNKSTIEERCVSPYPMVTPGSPSLQREQTVTINTKERRSPLKLPALISSNQKAKVANKNNPETPHDVAPHLVKFARDSSEYWYKPHMTREEAVALLRQAPPGTFIIRNSTTYKNAFGLVLRVYKPPQGVAVPETNTNSDVLVRHFLLEPTTRGVRLKGCSNEPTFTSLSALVYQHSINQLALPCKLIIPTRDLMLTPEDAELIHSQKQLLEQGAACNVLYLFSMNMESLTGDEAIRKTVHEMYAQSALPSPIEVHFKVSQNGITLTDNKRLMFFRRHYTPNNISHIAMDPDNRFYTVLTYDAGFERTLNKSIFAFVARPPTGGRDNQCHIFCDLASTQPASAIVSFAHKVLRFNKNSHQML
ncbi:tensin-1-like [Calliphora vicina]|uniref:tensin-1-like n=1 Tax=Calliphora vicina TaxID=7373 RepID=UPI00325B9601